MARYNYTHLPEEARYKLLHYGREIRLGIDLAAEITNGNSGQIELPDEQGMVFYVFDVKVTDTAEKAATGVEYNGEHETYVRHTFTAEIEYLGAYDWQGEDVTPDLNYEILAEAIEEQNNEYETIKATVK